MNIKPNQVLKKKATGEEWKVLEVLTQTALLEYGGTCGWLQFEFIEKNFDLPKEEKWKPEKYEVYYTPEFIGDNNIVELGWIDNIDDQKLYELGLVCKTEAEAQALAQKMLQAINE